MNEVNPNATQVVDHPIDWASLEQIDGPASAIPRLIAELVGPHEGDERDVDERRGDAFDALMRALLSPGQWFSATLPTASMLVEAVANGQPGLDWVLKLLVELMCADHLDWLTRPPATGAPIPAREREIREQVASIGETVRVLLNHDNVWYREAAALLLGCLPEQAALSLPALSSRIEQEFDATAKANMIFSVFVLERKTQRAPSQDRHGYSSDESLMLRSATALGYILHEQAEPRALSKTLWQYCLELDGLCWGRRSTQGLVAAVGNAVGSSVRHAMVDALIDALENMGRAAVDGSERVSGVILGLGGFIARWPEPVEIALPEELTDEQRAIAERLANCGTPYGFGHGLPQLANYIRRWLAVEPMTPLEERISVTLDGVKRDRPRWWVWRHASRCGLTQQKIDEFVERLDAVSQIQVICDCASRGYALGAVSATRTKSTVLPELLASVSDTAWVAPLFEQLLQEPHCSTPVGPIAWVSPFVTFPLFSFLIRRGHRLQSEWLPLTPYRAPKTSSLRELLVELSFEFREEAMLRWLHAMPTASIEFIVPNLDLITSRRVVRHLLALESAAETISDESRALISSTLDRVSGTHPEVLAWQQAWKSESE